jgi:hypothetical protein
MRWLDPVLIPTACLTAPADGTYCTHSKSAKLCIADYGAVTAQTTGGRCTVVGGEEEVTGTLCFMAPEHAVNCACSAEGDM